MIFCRRYGYSQPKMVFIRTFSSLSILMSLAFLAACTDVEIKIPEDKSQDLIEHRGFKLQGLTEHRVIDTNYLAMGQNATKLSDKIQTIKLLDPELISNKSAIRFYACEKGITPDVGSCVSFVLARAISISQDTLVFGLDLLKGKAGVEYALYLSIPGNPVFYQEVNNQHFIFPQDHYAFSYSEEHLMGDKSLDGIHLNPSSEEILFDVVLKHGVMSALKADEEVKSFKAALYDPFGEHIKDLRVFHDLAAAENPYSLKVENKSNCCSIELLPGSYVLHIDYPYTSPPLLFSRIHETRDMGVNMIYNPNGFLIPLEIWGSSTIEMKLAESSVLNVSETINALDNGFHLRTQGSDDLAYRDASGWVYNSRYLSNRFAKELEQACTDTSLKEKALRNERALPKNAVIEDFEISFSGMGRSKKVKIEIEKEQIDVMDFRITGEHVVHSEVNCWYTFNSVIYSENDRPKISKHSGSIPLTLISNFKHDNMPAR